MQENSYRICSRCLMDTSDPEIVFDGNGHCNHCNEFLAQRAFFADPKMRENNLKQIVTEIREKGKNRQYDCIIGVSGGTDSTYVAYTVKKLGLRPLAVHIDNGWNAELAVNNIENALKKLDIDLYTHVIDWEEFKDIQIAFLKASVVDAEMPTDHAIRAVLYREAARHGVKYIINGRNFNTEGLLPWSWSYSALDWRYLKDIHRRFGGVPIRSFPHFSLPLLLYYVGVKRLKLISILNYIDYNKNEAADIIQKELGWRDYGGKHYESIYTRFFQAYILPHKFGIDKRKAHLSVLVCTGQMEREEALGELDNPTYPEDRIQEEREYIIKKLDLTEDEFDEIMELPINKYTDFRNNANIFLLSRNEPLLKMTQILKKIGVLPKGFADYATTTSSS